MKKKPVTKTSILERIDGKSQLCHIQLGSSPSFGTEIDVFFSENDENWQGKLAANPHFPYRECRLVHHNYDVDKDWYVLFYAWDVSLDKLTRRRLFDQINTTKNVRVRLNIAETMMRVINGQLRSGKVLGKDRIEEAPAGTLILKMTVAEAIDHVGKEKATTHRANYTRMFGSLALNWREYLQARSKKDILISKLTRGEVFDFFAFLSKDKKLSNKTFNNYRGYLATVINFLIKREPKLFKAGNPAELIDNLPVIARKHAALTDAQMKLLIDACRHQQFGQMELFIHFEYYTLARPGELCAVRIKHIDLEQSRIFMPGDTAKGRSDEYVGIPARLAEIITESGILKADPNHFVFSRKEKPGMRKYESSMPFWKKNVVLLEVTGLNKINENFSLYSYKHSGAISLYQATKDIKLLQRQCRHKTVAQTEAYLRDLGLMAGLDAVHTWKGAI